jgi:hypothetical protein
MTDFEKLLYLLHKIGTDWAESGSASQQVWGRHLVEDWRTLELLAPKLAQAEP